MPGTAEPLPARSSETWVGAIFTSGWLWGLAATCGFYAALPYLPADDGSLKRYFTAHWIEYATTGLFFIGMATLLIKGLRLPSERHTLNSGLLDGLLVEHHDSASETANQIVTHLRLVARRQFDSQLVRRISDVCDYVRGRRSTEGLEGHLNYLADSAAGRLHDSYALVRTVTWAVPILGFLGTVIGITMSIANITPDQLETSLNEVTSGLAVAFDTTALSLAFSMVLVFTTFVIERQEQQVLDRVEDFSVQRLLAMFPAKANERDTGPLMEAERVAADQLLAKTESLVTWQMDAWQTSLESLRERWSATLAKQQVALDQALQSGLGQALTDHAQQLAAARSDFVSAFSLAAESIRDQLTVTQQVLNQQHIANLQELQATWQKIQGEMGSAAELQAGRWAEFSRDLATNVGEWQAQLREASVAMAGQLAEMRQQGGILLRIVEQEEQLVRLEDRLTHNLETVRMVDTLDETLVSLNAAVNLLSAKTRAKAA